MVENLEKTYSIRFRVVWWIDGKERITTVKKVFPLIKGVRSINNINIAIREINDSYSGIVNIQPLSSSF